MDFLKYQPEMSKFLDLHRVKVGCPRVILLYGPSGHGQNTFLSALSSNLAIPVIDMTDCICSDSMQQIALSVSPNIYYINLNNISVKEQSSLLITLENPRHNTFFVMEGTSDVVLSAIKNRSYVVNVDYLMLDELRSLFPTASLKLLRSILSPEEIEEYLNVDLAPYDSLLDNMQKNFNRANISNILTISNKFKLEKDLDGMDVKLFCALLLNRVVDSMRIGEGDINLFYAVKKLIHDIYDSRSNKRRVFENFLISAKEANFRWC